MARLRPLPGSRIRRLALATLLVYATVSLLAAGAAWAYSGRWTDRVGSGTCSLTGSNDRSVYRGSAVGANLSTTRGCIYGTAVRINAKSTDGLWRKYANTAGPGVDIYACIGPSCGNLPRLAAPAIVDCYSEHWVFTSAAHARGPIHSLACFDF